MSLPEVLEHVRRSPRIFVNRLDFDTVAALVKGFDLATDGGLLCGFREWLIVRVGDGDSISWDGLVRLLAFSDSADVIVEQDDELRHKQAIDVMFDLISEFRSVRKADGGLHRILLKYDNWLRKQDWYDESSPECLSQ